MPQFIQKRVHAKKATIKPEDGRTCTEKVCLVLLFNSCVLVVMSFSCVCYPL